MSTIAALEKVRKDEELVRPIILVLSSFKSTLDSCTYTTVLLVGDKIVPPDRPYLLTLSDTDMNLWKYSSSSFKDAMLTVSEKVRLKVPLSISSDKPTISGMIVSF